MSRAVILLFEMNPGVKSLLARGSRFQDLQWNVSSLNRHRKAGKRVMASSLGKETQEFRE